MVTDAEREGGQVGGGEKNVIMGLYEILCVELLRIVKHYGS